MTLAAIALLGTLVYLLTGTGKLFVPKETIYTYMNDSAALARGAPVRLNGYLIGSVTSVGLSGEAAPQRIIRIQMSVEASALADIPVNSEAYISAENVLGTKYINIQMGTSKETIKPGGVLPSKNVGEFEEVVQSGYDVMVAARVLLRRIDAVVTGMEEGRGTIGALLVDKSLYNRLNEAVSEVQKVAAAVSSGHGTVGRLLNDDTLYYDMRGVIRRLDTLITSIESGQGTAAKLIRDPALYNEARDTLAGLRRTVDNLNQGKGTMGKLLTSDQLHNEIQDLVMKLDDIMEKIDTGQGTLGQLVVNPSLYESLNGATAEARDLLKDFRANPKKFLTITLRLF